MRRAEYPAAERILLHLSDTHLRGPGPQLFDSVDGEASLTAALDAIESSGIAPDAIVFTGDLVDLGEAAAYDAIRALVDPFADRLGARLLWVMGNHDDRGAFREHLLDETPADPTAPYDRVDELDGLRIVTLDTSVPGHHHGELSAAQLEWLRDVLATPAPLGTVLAMHHPPVPSVLPLAASVELRDQNRLADVLRGTDVRAIIAGHLHYSTFATFAGIPVSVASSTCTPPCASTSAAISPAGPPPITATRLEEMEDWVMTVRGKAKKDQHCSRVRAAKGDVKDA